MSDEDNQPFDLGSALARIGNIPTQDQLGQAAQDEGAAYRGRLAQEQPQAPENPTFNGAMIEPITPLSPQSQPPYDYYGANLESGRNISNQSFVDSYNKQAAAEPRVDPLNRIASALAGRPASPYNANPSNYRQLTPSEEAEKYRSEQSEYAGLAAGIATPELASATGLARFAPGPNQVNMFLPARAQQVSAAEKLEQQSVHPDNILQKTGAFRDVDGRWMRELSDASSRVTPEAQQFIKDHESVAGPATDVFEHPELYKQAPSLKKYQMDLEQEPEFITSAHPDYFPGFQQKAEIMEQMGYSPKEIFKQSNMVRTPEGEWDQRYFPRGWVSPEEKNIRVAGANPEDFRKVILHESSHAVDSAIGRPNYGANDDYIYQELAKLPKEEVIARAQASHSAGSPWAPNLADYKDNWEGFLRQQASDEYMRNAAEARARNVETRRNMSEAERLNTHPFKTMDIPPEQQIVGYKTTPGSSQLSAPALTRQLDVKPSGDANQFLISGKGGENIGYIDVSQRPYEKNKLRIDLIHNTSGQKFTPQEVKQAISSLKAYYPDVEQFVGDRVTGTKSGWSKLDVKNRKSGGSISDSTRALLARVKRQDGGPVSPDANAQDNIPTIDPAPLIPKSISDLAPSPPSENVAGTPTYGGTINPFESKSVQDWEPLAYGIPYLGVAKMAQQLPSVARTMNATEEGMRVPGVLQGIYDKVSNLPSNASEIVSSMWNNRWPSSSERVEAAYEGLRTRNAELYKLDPQGYLDEVAEHAVHEPTGPGEAIQKDEYMRGVPLNIRDKAYRYILQKKGGSGAFETATSPSQDGPKNIDRLGPGGFETQVVPTRARGGTISDKTNALLARLKKRA